MYSTEKDSDAPPPYSEQTYSSSSRSHTILNQLSSIRTRQIHSVLNAHIIPLIEERATYGIAQTTIALLPSDIPLPEVPEKSEFSFDDTSSDSAPVQVIGFASEDEPRVVRLDGHMNRTEFWRLPAVIEELEQVLSQSLNASPVLTGAAPVQERAEEITPTRQSSRRTLLSRVMPSLGPELRSPSGNPEVGVRRQNCAGTVVVRARLEEICLRTVSEFGLYDTMSKQCVIVRVDARC
ncbi:hypothetical protein PtrSN002B_001362 [Pyrenophora tritici-repentis]|uniref:Uncharacterized protein n=2 Tax=Pyrenophora tritici-repentis TaxID=45151 RepID=A0A2W1DGV7_9PLEO|nr:uncharacterized protein PTRG_01870 [Pyrenophora tritici-repentis Pt-1C-BFP]KAA8626574.1 hypothetical protein PtrV1_02254 [Pyrenophora tritici-repentis]EDU41308.1 conserved hypothetical protein [Pyrenophora tritici-repentis Pt-1C-BFP]KAF7455004.1 hypothetical protein A1F99_022620 [Pyrenophora tritici-repentis]KAF7578156.1 hypothetical protein PtrM4_023960 [Pyrenophora tritici-repentis]KAG9388761.1 hypothetical protein A1F94_001654 [Pyrenophora tritici-repentis]